MELGVLFYLAIIVFCGLAFGRLAKLCKLPNVTGYLIAGLILGPSVLGIIPEEAVTNFHLISDMALGFIAFSIGSEFKMSYFKHVGFTRIVIAIFEVLLASVAVTLGMLALGNDLAFSLVIGSIAAATAPAATIMVVRQYKAKGRTKIPGTHADPPGGRGDRAYAGGPVRRAGVCTGDPRRGAVRHLYLRDHRPCGLQIHPAKGGRDRHRPDGKSQAGGINQKREGGVLRSAFYN